MVLVIVQRDCRFPSSGHIQGAVEDLAAAIPVASVTKERLDGVAKFVADHIDKAAEALKRGTSPRDCERIARKVYQRSALRRAGARRVKAPRCPQGSSGHRENRTDNVLPEADRSICYRQLPHSIDHPTAT